MGHKDKHNRALNQRRARGQLLQRARETHPTWLPSHFVPDAFGYHDGKLVHAVFHGKRTISTPASPVWSEYVVWATGCNQVISIEKPRFAQSKRPVTCLQCLCVPDTQTIVLTRDTMFEDIEIRPGTRIVNNGFRMFVKGKR